MPMAQREARVRATATEIERSSVRAAKVKNCVTHTRHVTRRASPRLGPECLPWSVFAASENSARTLALL